ncbi:unnamed protein product [Allacma fusca]|uniref:Uncharacterized protein n=1 Tax=Allacma fusca TaxID=39272 RepID=A0A8J2JSL5_9HEXA|nr:unnamed protein product [Allacma fusca]
MVKLVLSVICVLAVVATACAGVVGHGHDNGDYHAHPKYQYSYGVNDHYTGDVKQASEEMLLHSSQPYTLYSLSIRRRIVVLDPINVTLSASAVKKSRIRTGRSGVIKDLGGTDRMGQDQDQVIAGFEILKWGNYLIDTAGLQ